MTQHTNEWEAGFFEGEGWIVFVRKQHKNGSIQHVFTCGITNTEIVFLERFAQKYGGVVRPRRGTKLSKKPLWDWRCYTKNADIFLAAIYPHLIGKKKYVAEQAMLLRSRMKRNKSFSGRVQKITQEEFALRDAIITDIRRYAKGAKQ